MPSPQRLSSLSHRVARGRPCLPRFLPPSPAAISLFWGHSSQPKPNSLAARQKIAENFSRAFPPAASFFWMGPFYLTIFVSPIHWQDRIRNCQENVQYSTVAFMAVTFLSRLILFFPLPSCEGGGISDKSSLMHINTTCLHRWTSQKQWSGFPCAKEQRKREENVHSSETPSGLPPTDERRYGKAEMFSFFCFLSFFRPMWEMGSGKRAENFPGEGQSGREKETEFSLSPPPQFFLPPPEPDTHFPPPSLKISSLFFLFFVSGLQLPEGRTAGEEEGGLLKWRRGGLFFCIFFSRFLLFCKWPFELSLRRGRGRKKESRAP